MGIGIAFVENVTAKHCRECSMEGGGGEVYIEGGERGSAEMAAATAASSP